MLPISKMAAAVQPSATLAAGAKAQQLRAAGKTIYDFSLGEPDFNTPRHICEAGYQAMLAGHTHYTPAPGIVELHAPSPAGISAPMVWKSRPSRSSSPTAPSIRCTMRWQRRSVPATRSSFPLPTGSATAISCR